MTYLWNVKFPFSWPFKAQVRQQWETTNPLLLLTVNYPIPTCCATLCVYHFIFYPITKVFPLCCLPPPYLSPMGFMKPHGIFSFDSEVYSKVLYFCSLGIFSIGWDFVFRQLSSAWIKWSCKILTGWDFSYTGTVKVWDDYNIRAGQVFSSNRLLSDHTT